MALENSPVDKRKSHNGVHCFTTGTFLITFPGHVDVHFKTFPTQATDTRKYFKINRYTVMSMLINNPLTCPLGLGD